MSTTTYEQHISACDPDAFGHVHPDGLFCGDCSLVNARYLADYLPGIAPDRAHYTVAEIEDALDAAEDELADIEPYDPSDEHDYFNDDWELDR